MAGHGWRHACAFAVCHKLECVPQDYQLWLFLCCCIGLHLGQNKRSVQEAALPEPHLGSVETCKMNSQPE